MHACACVLQVCRALLAVHDSAGAVPVTRSAELLTKLLDPAGMVLQADDVLTHADKQCGEALGKQHAHLDLMLEMVP